MENGWAFEGAISKMQLRGLLGALLLCACVASHAQTSLPAPVVQALQDGGVPETSLAALVLPAHGGAPLLAYQDERAMSPASTMKLVTTLVGLETLGPTYRWKTQLLSTGKPQGDKLKAPLYLQGGGDPHLHWDALRGMLRTLRAQGVRRLEGDLILDRSLFNPNRPDVGAPQFDESPQAYYNVIPDALLVHGNMLDLSIDSTGKMPVVRSQPPLHGVQIKTQLTLEDSDCKTWDDDLVTAQAQPPVNGKVQVVLQGVFPKNCVARSRLNLLDRNDYVERFVRAFWIELGGTWKGHVRDGIVDTQAQAQVLVTRPSDNLTEVVRLINKPSDNAMTRTLFLTLGTNQPGDGLGTPSSEKAKAVVLAWFDAHNISTHGLVLDNGSGLSRSERITARQMAGLLHEGIKSNWYPEFASSMPIVGVDGTMRKRNKDTAATGRARIKTGTLRDTAAIAGYVRDRQNRDWIVVGFINDQASKKGRPALDALIQWVAEGQ
jgi:D-alanyl-D-alanine carboxypeptidase/D-alanyl-D-alanine-endopeptidase (penicillin-binding protein 4)